MTIAKTIREQINGMDPRAFWAWGVDPKTIIDKDDGIEFLTTGMVRWKGYVYVQYDYGMDHYNVIFSKNGGDDRIIEDQVDGVYFDELVTIIDQQVG